MFLSKHPLPSVQRSNLNRCRSTAPETSEPFYEPALLVNDSPNGNPWIPPDLPIAGTYDGQLTDILTSACGEESDTRPRDSKNHDRVSSLPFSTHASSPSLISSTTECLLRSTRSSFAFDKKVVVLGLSLHPFKMDKGDDDSPVYSQQRLDPY
jgi:hypothetical protein